MIPYWPPQCPQRLLIRGMQFDPGDNTLRSPTSSGYPKARRLFTRSIEKVQGLQVHTKEEIPFFMEFYKTTLVEGSLPFYWVHPITDEDSLLSFAANYKLRSVDIHYELSLEINILKYPVTIP